MNASKGSTHCSTPRQNIVNRIFGSLKNDFCRLKQALGIFRELQIPNLSSKSLNMHIFGIGALSSIRICAFMLQFLKYKSSEFFKDFVFPR